MAIRQARVEIAGINPLLVNNPQVVDPFNRYKKLLKPLHAKGQRKTDDDILEIGNIEVESKLYFDTELKVYIPASWLMEATCTTAFQVSKIGRSKMRGGLFPTESKIKLAYSGMDKVKTIDDVVGNPDMRIRMLLPQKAVRIAKDAPIFHDWSFSTVLEFDDSVIDFPTLKRVIQHASRYGGFGDFRPTFGRATAEVSDV